VQSTTFPILAVNTSQFGTVTEAATPARQIQFAMRYSL